MAKMDKIKFLSNVEVPGLAINNKMFGYEVPDTITPNSLFFVVEDLPENASATSQSSTATTQINKIKFLSDIEAPKLFASYGMFGNVAPENIKANELFFVLNATDDNIEE